MEEVPANAVVRAHPTLIPAETFLLILRWLQRFDLDGVQITSKRLRSLVENNKVPLRILDKVLYIGDGRVGGPKNVLLLESKERPMELCPLDAFIRQLVVSDHKVTLPNPQLLSADDERISTLAIERCNFNIGEDNALEKTLSIPVNRRRFKQLFVESSKLPGWQLNNGLLHKLCCAGCTLVHFADNAPMADDENYAVTDEGILDYCFSSDLGVMRDRGRTLTLARASTTHALASKCVQASAESKATGRVILAINGGEFVDDHFMDTFCDNGGKESSYHIRFDFPDQGNGTHLQINFTRAPFEKWMMHMHRRKKVDEANAQDELPRDAAVAQQHAAAVGGGGDGLPAVAPDDYEKKDDGEIGFEANDEIADIELVLTSWYAINRNSLVLKLTLTARLQSMIRTRPTIRTHPL